MIDIVCGNARDVTLGRFFDVLITDPPYSAHVHANAVSQSSVRGTRLRDLGFASLGRANRSYVADCAAVARWAVVFSDWESMAAMRIAVQARRGQYIRCIPWVRWSMPQLSGDRPPQGSEAILLFANKGKKHWNGPGNLTHFASKCLRGDGKHPTEKPLDLALDLVSYFSDPGETVYDPYSGSGTFALACALTGRNCLAIEQDKAFAAASLERLRRFEVDGVLSERDNERARRWLETKEKKS